MINALLAARSMSGEGFKAKLKGKKNMTKYKKLRSHLTNNKQRIAIPKKVIAPKGNTEIKYPAKTAIKL